MKFVTALLDAPQRGKALSFAEMPHVARGSKIDWHLSWRPPNFDVRHVLIDDAQT